MTDQQESAKPEELKLQKQLVTGMLLFLGLLLLPTIVQSASLWFSPPAPVQRSYQFKLDLATASLAEVLLIPGFGETLATRWIEQRAELLKKHPEPLDAIAHMRGIGQQKLAVIREYALPSQPENESVAPQLAKQSSTVLE